MMADLSPYTMTRINFHLSRKEVNLAIEILRDEARNRYPLCAGDCRTTIAFKKLARDAYFKKLTDKLNIEV